MATHLSFLFIGFSMLSSLLLIAVYLFSYSAFEKTWLSISACCGLMLGLAGLQSVHMSYLQGTAELLHSHIYTGCLLISTASFYIFGRAILQFDSRANPLVVLHSLPLLVSPFIPTPILIPFAFVLGTAYAIHISILLYALRGQRKNFSMEFSAVSGFALIAAFILMLGCLSDSLGERLYVLAYADLIGIAYFAMIYILLRFPDITQKARDAVIASYAASTLKNSDCNALAAKVKQLFGEQKLHRNENLSLAQVASELELSSHQTSELINTQFGVGFSRLVREYRIEDAKRQLVDEPKASVLSIGLSVGFNSQSNFYTAFREIAGQTPAQFRKTLGITTEFLT
jgi:AraC-like DNA-binding protein